MKLSTSAILSLIGAILVLAGMFIPAAYGIVANGINSNGHITLFEFGLGFIILIAALLTIFFAIIKNLERWSWVLGVVIISFGMITLIQTLNTMKSISLQMPMAKEFIYLGPGFFVVIAGGISILISGIVANYKNIENVYENKRTKEQKLEHNGKEQEEHRKNTSLEREKIIKSYLKKGYIQGMSHPQRITFEKWNAEENRYDTARYDLIDGLWIAKN